MTIKVAKIEDLPRILEIRYDAIIENSAQTYSPREIKILLQDANLAELREMILDQKLFIAYVEQQIVGLTGWKDLTLKHVYIDPKFERRGIASKLVMHTQQDYITRTKNNILKTGCVLYAVDFYQKQGFEIIHQVKDWDGSEYYQMEKKL